MGQKVSKTRSGKTIWCMINELFLTYYHLQFPRMIELLLCKWSSHVSPSVCETWDKIKLDSPQICAMPVFFPQSAIPQRVLNFTGGMHGELGWAYKESGTGCCYKSRESQVSFMHFLWDRGKTLCTYKSFTCLTWERKGHFPRKKVFVLRRYIAGTRNTWFSRRIVLSSWLSFSECQVSQIGVNFD